MEIQAGITQGVIEEAKKETQAYLEKVKQVSVNEYRQVKLNIAESEYQLQRYFAEEAHKVIADAIISATIQTQSRFRLDKYNIAAGIAICVLVGSLLAPITKAVWSNYTSKQVGQTFERAWDSMPPELRDQIRPYWTAAEAEAE